MPIYAHNGALGQPVNISGFVAAAQAGVLAGPLPFLNGVGNQLGVHATAFIPISMVAAITRAIGLVTCASVIYASTHPLAPPGAWVHHANAGHVAVGDVNNALVGLGGPPPATVIVIFAHPGAHDPGYAASILTITGQGIPVANVVEIPNLVVGQFGINNLGMIG